ncbi:MAG: hypothetical protein H8K06_17720 [Nitrospira sp.]|uniref:Lipoprotein n=1 Tax=Nitrospira defluvii TaxID=330214 RepID=A0ABM8QAY1_9BACT|nr:hypothetical protein [Nitrospira defluvii]MCS6328907.1 hypothetical protein [Nitrospira sp.]CAE6686811.1 conserved hypothetical protein [Nitrospira defluvii]
MIRQHVVRGLSAPVAVGLLLLFGCSGKGDIIPMNLTPKAGKDVGGSVQVVKAMPGPRVAVIPFEDARADRAKVGSRTSMWGGETDFNVSSGSAGEETAQAFADYLKRKGWQAQYAKAIPAAENGPDIVLSGKILELAVDAKRGFLLTDIEARTKLVIQAKNREDESSIVRTDAHSGNHDNVFWFDPQDGEDILSEVLEKNFERFVVNTRFEDRSIRFR